jgi:hypothetical protein
MTEDHQQRGKTTGNSDKTPNGKERRGRNRRFAPTSGEKKDPDAIPMLKYGPGNNFMKFKEALSKKALQEYGEVGRLILKERLVRPPEPDPSNYNTAATNPNARLEELKYIEDIKVHRKKVTGMERDMPKLYAFILK